MSWDIFVQDLPSGIHSVDDIPDDFTAGALGKRCEIISSIKKIVPSIQFPDSSSGVIKDSDYTIEIDFGTEEECSSFAFHVTGQADNAASLIQEILKSLNIKALDPCSDTGLFRIDADNQNSANTFQNFRDRILE